MGYKVSIDGIVAMRVGDYYWLGDARWIRHIENGIQRDLFLNRRIQNYIDEYLRAAGIENEKTSFLFRSTLCGSRVVTNSRVISSLIRLMLHHIRLKAAAFKEGQEATYSES